MIHTNDVYNDAIRESIIHTEKEGSFMGSKVVATLLLTGIAYIGFNLYNPTSTISTIDKALIVKNELVAEIQNESELIAVADTSNSEEEDYLNALRSIESELTEERENINLDASEQMDLSLAMNNLLTDSTFSDDSNYANELRKEIGVKKEIAVKKVALKEKTVENIDIQKLAEQRVVVVKKGDTLQGISNKFYGDAMNYKRIIASNASLHANDTIYVGQTILLPY